MQMNLDENASSIYKKGNEQVEIRIRKPTTF